MSTPVALPAADPMNPASPNVADEMPSSARHVAMNGLKPKRSMM